MIFHTWHVFISSSLPPPPQGFCRSSRRYFSWTIKPRASSSKPTFIDCSSVTALRAVVYIPSPPLLYSYLYSVLATASLFILAFQTAFLLLPPKKHIRCNKDKLPSLLSTWSYPLPIQIHLPGAHLPARKVCPLSKPGKTFSPTIYPNCQALPWAPNPSPLSICLSCCHTAALCVFPHT